MPAYNDTPLSTDRISNTQAPIRENFQSLSTVLGINHVVPITGADAGKHTFLQLPEQGAAPATAVNEGALYSAVGAVSTVTELCFRRENSGTVIPFTKGSASYTRLPSGLLLRWGNNTWTGVQTKQVCTVAPFFTNVYAVFMTLRADIGYNRFIYYGSAAVVAGVRVDLSATGCNANGIATNVHADYLIIGD